MATHKICVSVTAASLCGDALGGLLNAPFPQHQSGPSTTQFGWSATQFAAHRAQLQRWLSADELRNLWKAFHDSPVDVISVLASVVPPPVVSCSDVARPSCAVRRRERILTVCTCLLNALATVDVGRPEVGEDLPALSLALVLLLRALLWHFVELWRRVAHAPAKKTSRDAARQATGLGESTAQPPPWQLRHPAEAFAQAIIVSLPFVDDTSPRHRMPAPSALRSRTIRKRSCRQAPSSSSSDGGSASTSSSGSDTSKGDASSEASAPPLAQLLQRCSRRSRITCRRDEG